ncbi:MAG: L-threonylcarbamoyladenylate synthase [Alphaproteobacteria bacterium]
MEQQLDQTETIQPPTDAVMARAVALLRAGEPVGLPTETVYGLAADACNDKAVARIFEIKGRPHFNPLIAHCADIETVRSLVDLPALAVALAEAFWPGPLTLVLKRRADCPVSLLASAGLETLAVRVPAHPVAHALLKAFGGALAAPSANPSGRISPTTARDVTDALSLDLVIDGGPCTVGLESTILSVDGDKAILLRAGGVPLEDIEDVLGSKIGRAEDTDPITAPGQLRSHYAPEATLRLNALDKRPGEVLLGFGAPCDGETPELNLSEQASLQEAAANLFRMLRNLDDTGAKRIAVAPVPEIGLGRAINDRLRRAAAPRP